jgi:zinc-ribbon domain
VAAAVTLLRRRRRRVVAGAARQLPRPGVEVPWDGAAGTALATHNGQPWSRSPADTEAAAGHDEAAASGLWADAGAAPTATTTAVVPEVSERERPAVRFCSRCGNDLEADDHFCGACGHRVR